MLRLIRRNNKDRRGADEIPPFEELLIAYLDCLLSFANRLVRRDDSQAEDLVQQTCLQAFKKYGSLRSPSKAKSWLFQILARIHLNEYRRLSREPALVDVELSDSLLASVAAPGDTPEESFFGQLLDSEIQDALDGLPVEFRTVVWLSDVEGLSYKEIAEVAGCSMGTVASRLYRGHSLLR